MICLLKMTQNYIFLMQGYLSTVGQPGAAVYRRIYWYILHSLYKTVNIKWFFKDYSPVYFTI